MKIKILLAILLRIGPLALAADLKAKNEGQGPPLQLSAMDDSLESFQTGSYRFLNRTPDLLQINFGGATHEFPPGELKIVTPVLPEAGGFIHVAMKNEQRFSLFANRFLAQRNGRELVIISPHHATKSVSLR